MSQPQGKGCATNVLAILGVVFLLLVLGIGGVVAMAMYARNEQETAEREASRDRQRRDDEAAAQAAQEAAKLEAEKQKVRTGQYLTTSDLTYYDKGIINDYRQLTGMAVLNRSKFPVMNLSGDVEWIWDNGARAASMPFVLKGSIAAGDTKTFSTSDGSMQNGTVQTGATKVRIHFTNVDIVE